VIISCEADRLVLDTVPGQAERIITHLDKYLIREQVVLADRTAEWGELLLAGPRSASLISGALPQAPRNRLANFSIKIAGHDATVHSIDMVGPVGFLVRAAAEHLDEISAALVAAGAIPCSAATVETARIEACWPLYGRDITEHNLPQEVARDAQAISFTKGCYLGQETVARIDALGHVNRTLCGLRFSGAEIPAAGTPLSAEDKPAGEVTSATFSPRLGAPLALGNVRRGHNSIGTRLSSPAGEAEVVGLPLS
ncbi:MAG: hypothetical protein K8T25_04340, partial [Planctomycetia bacterium]|nr:hypothetical protein [Planctomycetia bacterium]